MPVLRMTPNFAGQIRGLSSGQLADFVAHVDEVVRRESLKTAIRAVQRAAPICLPLLRLRTRSARAASPFGRRGAVASGTYMTSWETENHGPGARIFNDVGIYAQVIDVGRRAGSKMPPVEAIEEWIKLRIAGQLVPPGTSANPPKKSLLGQLNSRLSKYGQGSLTPASLTPAQLNALALGRAIAAANRNPGGAPPGGGGGGGGGMSPAQRAMLRRTSKFNPYAGQQIDPAELRRIAWLIAKAIATRGLRPRKVMTGAVNKVANIAMREVERDLDALMRSL